MEKKKIMFVCSLIILICLVGCAKQTKEKGGENMTSYEQISQDEAKEIMDSESGYIILDVRTIEEYKKEHIKGAICIPVETIEDNPDELTDKNQLILVYCRSGQRSKKAAEKLSELGYTNIKEFGGIITWPYDKE